MTAKRKPSPKRGATSVVINGSDKCLRGMAKTISDKVKPDFTVTAAKVNTVWYGVDEDESAIVIDWKTVSAGSGRLFIHFDPIFFGAVTLDTKAMGRDFAKEVLAKLIDRAKVKA